MRGKAAELQLAKLLWKRGYAVMRAPGSGKKYKKLKPPDIMAVKKTDGEVKVLIFEVKYRERPMTVYIADYTYNTLREYARRTGGDAYIAIKVKEWQRFVAVPLDELEEAELNGKRMYRITVAKMRSAREIDEVI